MGTKIVIFFSRTPAYTQPVTSVFGKKKRVGPKVFESQRPWNARKPRAREKEKAVAKVDGLEEDKDVAKDEAMLEIHLSLLSPNVVGRLPRRTLQPAGISALAVRTMTSLVTQKLMGRKMMMLSC